MKILSKIQSELKCPKTKFNSFGKYHYRANEDILEAVKPILEKYECTLTISDTVKEACGIIYIESTATITNGTEQTSVTAQAGVDVSKKGMDISQCFGSSSSYARKYALNGLFCIDDSQDADSHNDHGKGGQATNQTSASSQSNKNGSQQVNDSKHLSPDDKEDPGKWDRVIDWLKKNNKTAKDWPSIKSQGGYIITEQSEKKLFAAMGW